MFIDVLTGADYLWSFQKGCTIRGNPDEPVAVETELGWVLSGPMKSSGNESEACSVQVNLIGSARKERLNLESDVHKLWDMETLGIIESEDEVHEAFINTVSFTGNRYSVRLPWKEGHPELPSNYATSLRRLKTQVATYSMLLIQLIGLCPCLTRLIILRLCLLELHWLPVEQRINFKI